MRAAGVTRGALYHQFADKRELFAAVFEQVEAEVTAAHRQGRGRRRAPTIRSPRCASAPTAGSRRAREPEVQRIVLLDAPAVLGWERWREIGDALRRSALIEGALQAGDRRRAARSPSRSRPLAHVLIGALDEAALYVATAEDHDAARAEVGAVLDRLLGSLA